MASGGEPAALAEEEEEAEEDNPWEIDAWELEIQSTIGVGSTATVYLGLLRGVTVAVKEIESPQEKGVLRAFQRELGVLSQVEHPHILRFVGLVTETLPLRLCLEYCRGESLFELLHNCWHIPICWRQRLKVLLDTASAVNYLHNFTPPIMHRDLKSLNLLLVEPVKDLYTPLQVKLADFGFARIFEACEAGPMTKGAGTSHWMAPEVATGTDYTEKADIFSFAMIMYEVLCRHVAFETLDSGAASRKINSGERPDIESTGCLPAEVPPRLVPLMVRCWDHAPSARPCSQELEDELTEACKEVPPHMLDFAPDPEG